VFVRDRVATCRACGRRWDWKREAKDVTFASTYPGGTPEFCNGFTTLDLDALRRKALVR